MNTLNDSTVEELMLQAGESFSLKSNGNWQGSSQLQQRVEMLRSHAKKGPNQCGTSVASWGDKGGACTSSGGWGD